MAKRISHGFYSKMCLKETKSRNSDTGCKVGKIILPMIKDRSQEKLPAKRPINPIDRKSTTKPLPPLDDPDLPPSPEHLPAKQAVSAVVVTWNMQTSSDSLMGAVTAIGAYCPLQKVDMFVSRVVVEGDTTNTLGQSVIQDGVQQHWAQDEKQCLESFVKWLAYMPSGSESKGSRGAPRADNIVLLSFSGIAAQIPKLMLALRRQKMFVPFSNVVAGICDVNAASLNGDPSMTIATISRNVLGVDMPETDDPSVTSRQLYIITAEIFEKKVLAANLLPLARNTFTPSYVMKLSAWRLKTDHRATDLRSIVTTRVGKGVKSKRSLIKNLIAVGYDYGSLRKQYQALGEFIFREVLLNKLRHMKHYRESNLTETREVGCKTVIESVVDHFKEIQRERQLKRAPPLE